MYSPKQADHLPTSRSKPKSGLLQKIKIYRARMAEFQDNSPSSTIVKALVVLLLLNIIVIGFISARTFWKGKAGELTEEINVAFSPRVSQEDIPQPQEIIPVAVPVDETPTADLITQSHQVVDVRQQPSIAQAEPIVQKPAPVSSGARHTVRTGDTWATIARDNKVSVADLKSVNPKVQSLVSGSVLVIPAQPGQTPIAVAEPVRETGNQGGVEHVIKKGETLSSIARKYKVNWKDIQKLNKMTDRDISRIRPGQKILVPAK